MHFSNVAKRLLVFAKKYCEFIDGKVNSLVKGVSRKWLLLFSVQFFCQVNELFYAEVVMHAKHMTKISLCFQDVVFEPCMTPGKWSRLLRQFAAGSEDPKCRN